MLPFGHLAAGYLVADSLLKSSGLSPAEAQSLMLWGVFFAFAPDLDFFYVFAKQKSLTVKGKENHRDYWTHRPMLWLAAGLAIIALSRDMYWLWFGIILWLCSWSHFVLDSLRTGVRWLWPFDGRFFALREPGAIEENPAKGFFRHWINMISLYRKRAPLAFYLEIAIVATAVVKLIFS
jgi:inner membrane protein